MSDPSHLSASAQASALACDIFCAVIDNYGDVGVCWRLARQLAGEHGWQVRLIVDDLHTFARLEPAVDPAALTQTVAGIEIEHWHGPVHAGDTLRVADIVIEAFACELPSAYLAAMARRERVPVWLNLEYLSAEDWVADVHLKPSPHPRHALMKTFFFPGLGNGTGGVIKERGLDAARETFLSSSEARATWWQRMTLGPPPGPHATVVSLFAYENPAVEALLAQWRDAPTPVILLVPEGRISGALARFFDLASFKAPALAERGSLRAHALPFVAQPEFDTLLWSSDLNFVRGEDSLVRALWAGAPLVWQIYPQDDDAHHEKLNAWLDWIGAPPSLRLFHHAWNGFGNAPLPEPEMQGPWLQTALEARARLLAQDDLVTQLREFVTQKS